MGNLAKSDKTKSTAPTADALIGIDFTVKQEDNRTMNPMDNTWECRPGGSCPICNG